MSSIDTIRKRVAEFKSINPYDAEILLQKFDKAREALKDIEEKGMGYVKNIAKKALEEME